MIQDPWFYAAAVPAVLIAGISKGGFGGGVGLVAVPLMALVISPIQAAGIMLPILCMMDLFGVWAYRNRWDGRNLRILLPAALLGIAVGTASFRYLDGDMIRLMLGVMALAAVTRLAGLGLHVPQSVEPGRKLRHLQRAEEAPADRETLLVKFAHLLRRQGHRDTLPHERTDRWPS